MRLEKHTEIEEEAQNAPDPEKFKQICMYALDRVEKDEAA